MLRGYLSFNILRALVNKFFMKGTVGASVQALHSTRYSGEWEVRIAWKRPIQILQYLNLRRMKHQSRYLVP
jgi:hypothetical protein